MTTVITQSTLSSRRIPIPNQTNGFAAARSMAVVMARMLSLSLSTASAAPLSVPGHGGDVPQAEGADLWVLYVVSAFLVVSGGVFAGLTIAFMGQDGIYLQVMAGDPSEPQQKNAKRVYDLLKKGKHWVLVTLLLANVVVNTTLPVVLDRCLGGGVAAVVGSTFLIVIFGEVLPQSICVRYGLPIGGYMAKPVLAIMYLTAPLSWPMAKLLDRLLGAEHGTVYKKSGLKTLVTLHKSLGDVSQRLNQDEVTIISAVLDLKEKPVASVMTPMDDVFVISEDTVLDEPTMDMILSAGYSRIPIHETGNPTNFVGMLLVKILITYDPEDARLVRDFPLATLPETRPETSCLDIVNFFQEGKSHMVLVSEFPGEDHGALGVVTLEDVIEELIGEEIIDESDVYIDVHKAIRRLTPAPKAHVQRRVSEDVHPKQGDVVRTNSESALVDTSRVPYPTGTPSFASPMLSSSPKTATLMMRRSSAGLDGHFVKTTVPVRANIDDIRQHLRHLGPSNPATNPNKTRSTTVKVKPGSGGHSTQPPSVSLAEQQTEFVPREEGDETTSLLRPHVSGKNGIHALGQTYGSTASDATAERTSQTNGIPTLRLDADNQVDKSTQTPGEMAKKDAASPETEQQAEPKQRPQASSSNESADSLKTENTLVPKRTLVRSGSITENVIESRGVRKVVLETSGGSNDEEDSSGVAPSSPEQSRLRGRPTFGLFGRDSNNSSNNNNNKDVSKAKDDAREDAKDAASEGGTKMQPSPVVEEEEEEAEEILSPDSGGEEDAPESYAEAAAKGAAQEEAETGSSAGAAGSAGAGTGKKKNRRKKRKGGKS